MVWLKVLAIGLDKDVNTLEEDLSKLPYIGTLLKDHQDIEELQGGG